MPYKDSEVAKIKSAEYRERNRHRLREAAKKRHQDKRDEHLAYMRQYRIDNYERRKDGDLQRLYGISLTDYRSLLESQGGVCAICRQGNRDPKQWLSVDHCHKTGKIRGLLCNRCNLGIGYFDDCRNNLTRAVDYLIRADDAPLIGVSRVHPTARRCAPEEARPRSRTKTVQSDEGLK